MAQQRIKECLNRQDAEALCRIGYYLEKGYGLKQNYEEAMAVYKKAAHAGSVEALNNIGWLYFNGLGVPKDI